MDDNSFGGGLRKQILPINTCTRIKYDLQYPNRGLAGGEVCLHPEGIFIAAPTLCFENQECRGAAVQCALGGNRGDGVEDITMFTVLS